MSDDQNPCRGVLYKRMIGVCCCKFVVRFAWEAQESARAGARYINIVVLFCIISINFQDTMDAMVYHCYVVTSISSNFEDASPKCPLVPRSQV